MLYAWMTIYIPDSDSWQSCFEIDANMQIANMMVSTSLEFIDNSKSLIPLFTLLILWMVEVSTSSYNSPNSSL